MKKFKILFVSVLLGTFLMNAGGVQADSFTQYDVNVSFWLLDTYDPDLNQVTLSMTNINLSGYNLQYNDGSGWALFCPTQMTFDVEDEVLFHFRLIDPFDNTNIIDTGDLNFVAGTSGLYKGVIIHWGNGTTSQLTIGVTSDCDRIRPVPISPSALLLGSGFIGLIGFGLRRKSKKKRS